MVKILLPLSTAEDPDAADALAVAITHAHLAESNARMAELMARAQMIGKLTGMIDEIGTDFAVIDVGGVGYVVHCAARVLSNLAQPGHARLALRRNPHARGRDQTLRLHDQRRARMVPPAPNRARRRRESRALDPQYADDPRPRPRRRLRRQSPSRSRAKASAPNSPPASSPNSKTKPPPSRPRSTSQEARAPSSASPDPKAPPPKRSRRW